MTLHVTVASCEIMLYIFEHIALLHGPIKIIKIFFVLEMYLAHYSAACVFFKVN